MKVFFCSCCNTLYLKERPFICKCNSNAFIKEHKTTKEELNKIKTIKGLTIIKDFRKEGLK